MNVWLCAGGSKARGAQPGRGAAAISPTGPCQTKGSLAYVLTFARLSLRPITQCSAWSCQEHSHRQIRTWLACFAWMHSYMLSRVFQLLDSVALAVLHRQMYRVQAVFGQLLCMVACDCCFNPPACGLYKTHLAALQ